jgi:CBS domain-containing protein
MKEKVEEIMTGNVITVKENDSLLKVAEVFKENKIAGAPVVNEQAEVVGVISEFDMLKRLDNFRWFTPVFTALDVLHLRDDKRREVEKVSEMNVKEVMSKNPKTVLPDTLIDDAAQIMHSTGFNRLPVVDKTGKLVGIVARADIIASLYER